MSAGKVNLAIKANIVKGKDKITFFEADTDCLRARVSFSSDGVFVATNSEKQFTLADLAKFDGKEGRPAYVACNGKVYDVTEANLWFDGEHLGHSAGGDLSEALLASSHGDRVLKSMKLVGVLVT